MVTLLKVMGLCLLLVFGHYLVVMATGWTLYMYAELLLCLLLVVMAIIVILGSLNNDKSIVVYKNFIEEKNFELKKIGNHLPAFLLPLWCPELSCSFVLIEYSNFQNPGSSIWSPGFRRSYMDTKRIPADPQASATTRRQMRVRLPCPPKFNPT